MLALSLTSLQAQSTHKHLRQGDGAYKKENFPEAEINYRRALEKEESVQGKYNLGNTTYRQQRYDEAVKHYEAAAQVANDPLTKAKAFHNLGNAHFQNGNFKESIEAYKNALRLDPNAADTRQNLVNALRKIPPPPDTPPPSGDKQDNKDKDKQQQQDDQSGQDQQSPGDDQQPPSDDDPQEGEQPPPPTSPKGERPAELTREEARQLLEIMDREEQKVQEKLRKAQSKNKKSEKDW